MYFSDLSNYSYYLKTPVNEAWNIGWLEEGKSYVTGNIENDFLSKLASIIVGNNIVNVHVNQIRGVHPCALSGCDNLEVEIGNRKIAVGSSEIWVPSKNPGQYFASPSMILHYMKAHHYLPPKEFISAVMSFDLSKPFNAQDVYLEVIKGHF